ncbi:hypothetical protein [Cohnella sp.]|uniref:putative amidoligase domain-containing protein n=1 Tax=Cohnella sp. TaxID=1883426 RepID=UPI003568B14E
MMGQTGKLWLSMEGNKRIAWLEKLGIPRINDLLSASPDDCVMLVGKQGERERAIQELTGEHQELQEKGRHNTPWILNIQSDQISSLPAAEIERRLRREGLSAKIGAFDLNSKRITVTIWGLEAVEMRSSYLNSSRFNQLKFGADLSDRAILTKDHVIWRPAERMSIRALYVLGLDFGQVDLLFSNQGKLIVIGISSRLTNIGNIGKQHLREVITAFATAWREEITNGVQATLGADPEFVLLSTEGRIVPASRYFSPEGAAGCDSVRIRGERRWPLVELRPRPSSNPADVTADIQRLLRVASQRTAGVPLKWQAGASPVPGLPLGGHVHLSGMILTGERLRALDNAVALPLRVLEPLKAAKRRPRYGSLGDVRRQPHGGFEYRTPPSWLVSPRLALGAFALAKVAAEHSRELAFDRPLDEECYRDAFYEGDRTLLLEAAERMYVAISRTAGYVVYREPIDFVFDAIKRNRSWDESADIRVKWRIPIY